MPLSLFCSVRVQPLQPVKRVTVFFLFFKNTWCHFLFLKSCPDDQNNARILYMVLNQYTFSNILKKIRLSLVPFIKALKKRWSELTSSGTDYKTCTLGTYRFTKLNVCILLPAFVKKSGFCCLLLGVFFWVGVFVLLVAFSLFCSFSSSTYVITSYSLLLSKE